MSIESVVLLVVVSIFFYWQFVIFSHNLARNSGWCALALSYSFDAQFDGRMFNVQSGLMGKFGHYNTILNFGVNDQGLYLVPMLLFRNGYSSLFIPWEDIFAGSEGESLFPMVILKFEQNPSVTLTISKSLAETLAEASSGNFRISPE